MKSMFSTVAACIGLVFSIVLGSLTSSSDSSKNGLVEKKLKSSNHFLHHYCHMGDIDQVKSVLSMGSQNINSLNTEGESPLSIACKKKDISLLRFLIDTGKADPNFPTSNRLRPLDHACENSFWEGYDYLSFSEAYEFKFCNVQEALFKAARENDVAGVRTMIHLGGNVHQVDQATKCAPFNLKSSPDVYKYLNNLNNAAIINKKFKKFKNWKLKIADDLLVREFEEKIDNEKLFFEDGKNHSEGLIRLKLDRKTFFDDIFFEVYNILMENHHTAPQDTYSLSQIFNSILGLFIERPQPERIIGDKRFIHFDLIYINSGSENTLTDKNSKNDANNWHYRNTIWINDFFELAFDENNQCSLFSKDDNGHFDINPDYYGGASDYFVAGMIVARSIIVDVPLVDKNLSKGLCSNILANDTQRNGHIFDLNSGNFSEAFAAGFLNSFPKKYFSEFQMSPDNLCDLISYNY